MLKELKDNFTQAFGGVFVWVLVLVTLFTDTKTLTLVSVWRLVGIAAIFAFTFGVIYSFFWNYSTFKARTNIAVTSVVNFAAGMTSLYLFSTEMFNWILPKAPYILVLTFAGHVLGFYFYTKYENQKNANELNRLVK